MFLPNPGILAAGAGGRTYGDFVAHIRSRTSQNDLPMDSTPSGTCTVLASMSSLVGMEMTGSPWGYEFRPLVSHAVRIIQHALPSEEEWNSQRINGGLIFLSMQTAGSFDKVGLNRNGYYSLSTSSFVASRRVIEASWWDFSLNKPMMNNPFNMTNPSPYAAAGW